jgi:hypothetical protein
VGLWQQGVGEVMIWRCSDHGARGVSSRYTLLPEAAFVAFGVFAIEMVDSASIAFDGLLKLHPLLPAATFVTFRSLAMELNVSVLLALCGTLNHYAHLP